jgi:rod shape-determining protein MreB
MPEPLAAAIGDGADYTSPLPTLIVDIGEGVTDCAVIREGRLAGTFARRVACADLRTAVIDAVYRSTARTLTVDQATRLIYDVGADLPCLDPDGLPLLRFVMIPDSQLSDEVRLPAGMLQEAMEPVLVRIQETASLLLWETPALRSELRFSPCPVRLSGGGALIPGFANRIATALGHPVNIVRNPLDGVVLGAKSILPIADRYDLWQRARGL